MEAEENMDDAGYEVLDDMFVKELNNGAACVVFDKDDAKANGNALGAFDNNPNVKIKMNGKSVGGLDKAAEDRLMEEAMKEYEEEEVVQLWLFG